MVLKLVFVIISLVVVAFFTGLNLENKCDIWFFWTTFKNVPVFMTVIISFVCGILCSLPVFIFSHKKNKNEKGKEKTESAENKITYDNK